jgi:hypothetical protein
MSAGAALEPARALTGADALPEPRRRAVTVRKLDRAQRLEGLEWLAGEVISGRTAGWPPWAVGSLLAVTAGDLRGPRDAEALFAQAVEAVRLADDTRLGLVAWEQVDGCADQEQAAEETRAAASAALAELAGGLP